MRWLNCSALDRTLCWVLAGQERVIHFCIVDKPAAVREACYQADVSLTERDAEVVGSIVPGRIDYEALPINTPSVMHWMACHPPVNCVAFRIRVKGG